MSFTDELMQSLGPQLSQELSQRLNINPDQAESIIPKITPMILAGLKRQKDNFGGDDRVDHILDKYGSEQQLEHVGSTMQHRYEDPNAEPGLGGLIGGAGEEASGHISKGLGIDPRLAMKIIPMLAPFILSFLTRKRDGGLGTSGISSILDRDGDGSCLDDVAGWMLNRNRGGGSIGNLGGGQRRGAGGGLLGVLIQFILSIFTRRR